MLISHDFEKKNLDNDHFWGGLKDFRKNYEYFNNM